MSSEPTAIHTKRCYECHFEASADDEAWERSSHPSFGTLIQCPECGSTNIQSVG